MIKNQKQASATREKIKELIECKLAYIPTNDLLIDELTIGSLNGVITELEEQLHKYESLISGNFHSFKPKSLAEIPNILIAARLAQKLSQKDLAELLDLKEQQIQRYESTDYETASWPRIIEVAIALRLEFFFEKICILNTKQEEFEYPEGVTKIEAEVASTKLKKSGAFIFN